MNMNLQPKDISSIGDSSIGPSIWIHSINNATSREVEKHISFQVCEYANLHISCVVKNIGERWVCCQVRIRLWFG